MLPNLSSLHLRECAPVGVLFETLAGALSEAPKAPGSTKPRADWDPDNWRGEEPLCAICLYALDGPAEGNAGENDLQVEALFENLPSCGHCFHRKCLTKWVNSPEPNSNRCPTCKYEICTSLMKSLLVTRSPGGGPERVPRDDILLTLPLFFGLPTRSEQARAAT
jgi:hypothetical protein